MRNSFIDWLKGLLILLVILGHVLQGNLNSNPIRYFIYSFHMPLFIGLAGYLLNLEKLSKSSIITIFNNYKYRLLFPWLIASFVYFNFFYYFYPTQNYWLNLIKSTCIDIFYHLWFIPSFLSFIIFYWIQLKLDFSRRILFIIAFLISVFFLFFDQLYYLNSEIRYLSKILRMISHNIRPQFYIFFILGSQLKAMKIKNVDKLIFLLIPLFVANAINLEQFGISLFIKQLIYLVSNSLLIIYALCHLIKKTIKNKKIEWFGINSLGIYLWHIIPILLTKIIFNDSKNYYEIENENLLGFYFIALFFQTLFIFSYYNLKKIHFFKKYFFGL